MMFLTLSVACIIHSGIFYQSIELKMSTKDMVNGGLVVILEEGIGQEKKKGNEKRKLSKLYTNE